MSTLERVQQIVASVLRVPPATVTPTARLVDLAELDSLSLAEIASALDDEFAIRVPADDLTTLQTVDEPHSNGSLPQTANAAGGIVTLHVDKRHHSSLVLGIQR